MTSDDLVRYDGVDENVDTLAAVLVAGAASAGNALGKCVMPLERTAAACARLVAHLMVDQERRHKGTFREHMPGLWRGVLVRLKQQGQTRFLLGLLNDMAELTMGQQTRGGGGGRTVAERALPMIGASANTDADLASVWRAAVHAPLEQLLSGGVDGGGDGGARKATAEEEKAVLLQVVRLVELCPDGSEYRDAVRPESVCASLCRLYKRRERRLNANLAKNERVAKKGMLSTISWILQLAARSALATPDENQLAATTKTKAKKNKKTKKGKASATVASRREKAVRCPDSAPTRLEAIASVVRCGGAVFLLELLGTGGVAKGEAAVASSSLSVVFDCVDRAGEYATLQQSGAKGRFFRPCVRYLVAKGSVKGLLSHALGHGRVREAQMLIKMWHSMSAPENEKRAWANAKVGAEKKSESADTDLVRFTAERLGIDMCDDEAVPEAVAGATPQLDSVHLDLDALKERLKSMRGGGL